MSRFRVTVAQLMALVVFVGFGFAALKNATPLWASAAFSLAIVAVSAAIVGAQARKGRAQAACGGFAIAAGASLVIRLLTHDTVGYLNGPPRPWLYHLREYLSPTVTGGGDLIAYTQTCLALEAILLGLVGFVLGYLVAVDDGRSDS